MRRINVVMWATAITGSVALILWVGSEVHYPGPTVAPSPSSLVLPPTASHSGSAEHIPGSTIPSWLELRQDARAYTGDDGGTATALTICPSTSSYTKWSASITAVVPGCSEKPRGVPVTIVSNERVASNIGDYFVFIKADDSSWSGWTGSSGLQPRIPANTKVVVKTMVPGGEKWFFPNRTSIAGHIVLSDGTTLQILAQDPKSGEGPDLYAQILGNSNDTGKKGWLHRLGGFGLNVLGDGPLTFAPPNATEPQRR